MNTPQQPSQDPNSWAGQQPPQGGYQHPPMPPMQAPKRNWFLRHKILTGLVVLVILGIGISAANRGSNSGDTSNAAAAPAGSTRATDPSGTATSPGTRATASRPAKTDKARPGVGVPVRDGKFEFTVTKVETGKSSVGSDFMAQKAQGAYTLVYLTVKNIGDQSQTFFDSNQTVKDASGKEYDADSTADLSIESNKLFFEDINPGNSAKGVLAFDMPTGATATSIDLHDSMFSGGTTVQLH